MKRDDISALPDGLKARRGISKALTQAYVVQDIAFIALTSWKRAHEAQSDDGTLALGEDGATQFAQLVRAWETAQDRVRVNRSKPSTYRAPANEEKPKRFAARRADRAALVDVEALAEQMSAEHAGDAQDVPAQGDVPAQ